VGADSAAARALAAFASGAGGRGAAGGADDFTSLGTQLATLYGTIQGADSAPTAQTLAAVRDRLAALDALLARWRAVGAR
jgi:hypothetical protein